MAGKRQYRGLSKYNYYRLKSDMWSAELREYIPAGTKMLYWVGAGHSCQTLGDRGSFVTTNPVGGPMVEQVIRGRPQIYVSYVIDMRRRRCVMRVTRWKFMRLKPCAPLTIEHRISLRPDKYSTVPDTEVRAAVGRRLARRGMR